MQYRRSDFDVTNTVQVSSADAVRRAVTDLFRQQWPHYPFDRVDTAFRDFERLFNGQFPGYYGCDTVYHDLQHSLDGTLAVARLIVSYDRTHLIDERLGPERAIVGVVTALFHDAGYIRQTDDQTHRNGAEFTLSHVSRSAQFIGRYLPTIGMAEWVPVATKIFLERDNKVFEHYKHPALSQVYDEFAYAKAISRIITDKWTADKAADEMIERMKAIFAQYK